MVKVDAIRHSSNSVVANAKASRKQFDNLWNNAARAPMFCKITKKTSPDGKTKKFYRTARLIGAHAYMVAASGAAAYTARAMEDDCKAMHEPVEKESSRAPWMPTVSKGAKMLLEQFLCALSQEACMNAHAVREGAGNTKRLNRKHMQIGWDTVFDSIFSSSAIMPRSMYVATVDKSKKKKKGKSGEGTGKEQGADAADDEDYSPPDEDEDAADEAAADEAAADEAAADEA